MEASGAFQRAIWEKIKGVRGPPCRIPPVQAGGMFLPWQIAEDIFKSSSQA